MNIPGLTDAQYDDPKITHTIVEEDEYDRNNNQKIKATYDKTYFFPLTRWISDHRNEKITHKKYVEFNKLCSKVQQEWLIQDRDSDILFNIWDNTVHPVENAILHLWDVNGELVDWIVEDMYEVLLSTNTGVSLPDCSHKAFDRELEYRDGPNHIEMAVANIDSHILGDGEVPFDDEDLNKASESEKGQINYEHNLDQYLE